MVSVDVTFAKVSIERCPRCFGVHHVECRQLSHGLRTYGGREDRSPDFTHFFMCPKTEEPVLLDVSGSMETPPDLNEDVGEDTE